MPHRVTFVTHPKSISFFWPKTTPLFRYILVLFSTSKSNESLSENMHHIPIFFKRQPHKRIIIISQKLSSLSHPAEEYIFFRVVKICMSPEKGSKNDRKNIYYLGGYLKVGYHHQKFMQNTFF
jgi:hypothetical protein